MNKTRVGEILKNCGPWANVAFALLMLFALCASAMGQENTADSWYQKGQEREKMGSWQAAVDAYDQAIALNPEHKEAWCAKCKALSNANLELSGEEQNITFIEAIRACDKALDIDPKSTRSWSGKGFVLYQEAFITADPSKFNDSLLAYEKAIEVAGSDTSALTEAWQGKGTVLSQMGRNNEALAAQEKAIELNESDVEAWMGKAMALSKLGRNEEAVQSFDRIIELYPSEDQRIFDYPYIWYSKGRILEKLGRDEEAAQAYNKSIEDVDTIIDWVASGRDFYMNLSEAWQYKGQLLEEQGRYEEAVQALENATRVNPKSQRDWRELGTVLARDLGRYNQSLEAYDRALQLDPGDGDILTGKANVLRSLGRYNEALELYEKVLQHDMLSPYSFHYLAKAWLGKGEIFRIQGRYNESLLAYDKALELDPRYPEDVWIGRGRLLDSMGRPQEAQREYNQSFRSYREIVKNNSRRCDIWYGQGNALLGLKKYEEALQTYNNATFLNPNYAEAWFDKGLALLALNRDVEAEAAFTRARMLGYSAELQLLLAAPVIINVTSLGDDEFIELANNENVAQGIRNLRLIADGDENNSIILPDFTLEPEQKIRIHFGPGATNKTDLFLNGEITLNDTAGNLTLVDPATRIEWFMTYWTPETVGEDWFKKGSDLFRNQSYEEAIAAMDKVLETNPKNETAWDIKGSSLVLLASNMYDEALTCFDKAIEIYPQDIWAWNGKGDAFNHMRRYEDAIKAYDKALEIDAQAFGPVSGKASALWKLGSYNESLKVYDDAIELTSQDSEKALFWFEKAHLLAENGNYSETVKALGEVSRLAPQDKDLWINGGVLLSAHLGRYDEALKYYERALQIDPADGYAWYAKGEALKALDRQAEADEAYAKAKKLGYQG